MRPGKQGRRRDRAVNANKHCGQSCSAARSRLGCECCIGCSASKSLGGWIDFKWIGMAWARWSESLLGFAVVGLSKMLQNTNHCQIAVNLCCHLVWPFKAFGVLIVLSVQVLELI